MFCEKCRKRDTCKSLCERVKNIIPDEIHPINESSKYLKEVPISIYNEDKRIDEDDEISFDIEKLLGSKDITSGEYCDDNDQENLQTPFSPQSCFDYEHDEFEKLTALKDIHSLTKKQKKVLILKYIYGFSLAEIGRKMKITKEAVFNFDEDAKRNIKKHNQHSINKALRSKKG